jgi:hypothetical protein
VERSFVTGLVFTTPFDVIGAAPPAKSSPCFCQGSSEKRRRGGPALPFVRKPVCLIRRFTSR